MRATTLLLLPIVLLAGCADTILQGETSARLEGARGMLGQMVVGANAVSADKRVVHLSNPCSLKIGGVAFPVGDMQEQGTGGAGVNTILVFSSARALLHRIEYTSQRPLSCAENRLYLAGDLLVDGVNGNELTFGPGGAQITARHVDEVPGIMK
jgi:hypothetical protein